MKEKKFIRKQVIITMIGMVVLIFLGIFCYRSVEQMIVENEQKSLKSLAKMNARSLVSSLEGKRDLVYAALSGDMDHTEDIEKGLLKLREKGKYIPENELKSLEEWERQACEKAKDKPGEVQIGPVRKAEQGYYVLYMTKAVSIQGNNAGYVQIEWNLDEIYAKEQGLSDLQIENERDCIVKTADGTTVMPSSYGEQRFRLSHESCEGCVEELIYEPESGIPQQIKKLIAYETIDIGEESFVLYIIEDYNKITQPIETISFYLCLIGILVIGWMAAVIYKIVSQQKEETLLLHELQHEKTLNETMKKQEGLMQKYNHSKTLSVLTGSIAHEFNNLMTPIVLYTELLQENEIVQKEMPEELAELSVATKRCEELAKQLLGYSRQGKVEKVLTDYDVTYAVRESVNMVRKLLPANIVLKENICKTTYFIHGQVGALNQIMLNLATNAIHAMKEGGTLRIQFGLSTEDDNMVRLVMEDTGTGIPLEVRQKVFQPFFTTKPVGVGTGIGLTVVRRLTEEHGGRIRVKSEVGEGTTFILDFPRVRKDAES